MKQTNVTISICTIFRNEENEMAEFIETHQKLADELILVDTGSTDRSIEIVKSYNIQPYFFRWIDDFSAAKNYAVKKAASDWIIVLDADERIDPDAHQLIKETFTKAEAKSFRLPILNLSSGNWKSDYSVRFTQWATRAFHRNTGFKWLHPVHEQLICLNPQETGQALRLDARIFHMGYIDKQDIKGNRNEEIMFREWRKNKSDPHLSLYIARIINKEKPNEAFEILTNALKAENGAYHQLLLEEVINWYSEHETEFIHNHKFQICEKELLLSKPDCFLVPLVYGRYWFGKQNINKAFEFYNKTYPLIEQAQWPEYYCEVFSRLGLLNAMKGDFTTAKKYFYEYKNRIGLNTAVYLELLKLSISSNSPQEFMEVFPCFPDDLPQQSSSTKNQILNFAKLIKTEDREHLINSFMQAAGI